MLPHMKLPLRKGIRACVIVWKILNVCERNIKFKISFQFTLECGGTTSLGILLLMFGISEDSHYLRNFLW